jgi:CheY-like chemotaxis protein
LSAVAADGFVRVTVVDTGLGIAADKQDKIFQPFQRAGQETGSIEGTGIGLVISKRLAQLMKGDVGFRSVVNEGSEFWVDMPVHAAQARPLVPAVLRESLSKRLTPEGTALILYVEDNPSNVSFMQHLVEMMDGIDLLVAPTAEVGLELARQHRPAVIVMDINLPGMSGVDALHALRAAPETHDTPVIALTAAATERDKQRGKAAGFYQYLTKPVKVDEFIDALAPLLA